MNNTQHPQGQKAQVAENQQVIAENQTIESVLQPLKETFIARWIEDMKEHRADLVDRLQKVKREENERAFEIYLREGWMDSRIEIRQSAFIEGRVNDRSVQMEDVSFNFHNTRTARCEDGELRVWLKACDQHKNAIQKKIDRIPTREDRLEKMALSAWLKRLDTLERGLERKGLDVASARVKFFGVNAGDYEIGIADAEDRFAFARSILAGGFGTSVRLHLRFICT